MFDSIRKKLATIPQYISGNRLGFGVRLYFRNSLKFPVIIKTARGANIFLGNDPIDDLILKDLNIRLSNVYFPPELELVTNDVVLDVGGHHGIFAMELAAQFPGIRVLSFEPDKSSCRYFRFNRFINRNANVDLINAALDTKTHEAFIVKSEEGSWGNYVQNEASAGADKINAISVQEMLDNYNARHIRYLKFNAEGAEFHVIPELFRLLVFPELMMLFAHPEKGDVNKLVDSIRSQGYALVRTNNDSSRPWFLFRHHG